MITLDGLKKTISHLNYKWFYNQPNIIGIRTTLDVPDVFNDLLCVSYYEGSKEVLKIYTITTDPGVYYQKKLLNPKGCLVLKPGQYIDSHSVGFHQSKPTHKALVQTGRMECYRDGDLDGIAEETKVIDLGVFGCNIHGANNQTTTVKVGPWSAGCQVFSVWSQKEEFINICENYKAPRNKFTYTLIKEIDLQNV